MRSEKPDRQPAGEPRPSPECPHCGARDAEVISLFGTQAIALQYRCRACGDHFEAIKYDESQ